MKHINPKFAYSMQIAKTIPKLAYDQKLKKRAILLLCAELKKTIG
jgi:hypothetical protein